MLDKTLGFKKAQKTGNLLLFEKEKALKNA